MRHTRALILACALLGMAPAAHAQIQTTSSLNPTIGSPIAYRIGLPKGWAVEREDGTLTMSTEGASIFVGAMDLAAEADHLPVSDAEKRRILTNMFMGSDSLLFSLLEMGMGSAGTGIAVEEATREIRTLGGERAAYMTMQCRCETERVRMDMYVTVKDGIMYALILGAKANAFKRHEPLFANVRDSFTLASAPAPEFRTAEPPRSTSGRQRDGTWTSR